MLPIVHELGRTRLEVNVKLKANFSAKLFAVNLLVTVPVPDNTARAEVHTSLGAHPLSLISALILPCWSPCRRRTTRRAPTSTPASARARPASPPSCDPYPKPALLVTVPIADNTARAKVHTSLGARPAPPFAGRNGLSGREALPPSCSPCCAHMCAPAQMAERT